MRQTVLTGLAVLAAILAVEASPENAQEILEKVRKQYDAVKDAELKFTQQTRFSLSALEQHVSGTLLLKKEHKYRIETEDQTVVTDGETVWSYSVANKQVLIDHFKLTAQSLSPERILAGAPEDFTATTLRHEKLGKADAVVLKLTPRSEASLVSTLHLWVDPSDWLIRKVVITDVNGKETTYTVSEIKLNIGLSDSRFTMQIPEGVEVVDLR